jgi:hypothetical protein
MASDEVPLNVCATIIDQNLGGSNDAICKTCWEMKDKLEILISELKSTQLIIKILQEDISSSSTGTRIQANLTNCAEQNNHDELHHPNENKGTWKEIKHDRKRAAKHSKYNLTHQTEADSLPLLSNRYDALCNYPEDDDTPVNTLVSGMAKPRHTEMCKTNHKQRMGKKKKHKILIFGDSHAKDCAIELSHLLKQDFEVLGFVTPGSGMEHIKDTSMGEIKQLSKEDVVVLWGGSNDIAKNNSSIGMKSILELAMNATHTNVILMSAPHRYDLIETSCVNQEIKNFNRKLRKLRNRVDKIGKIEIIDVDNNRNLYTRHGQHLNSEGKESMAIKIASTIEYVLNKNVEPINEKWYIDNETPGSPITTVNKQGDKLDQPVNLNSTSGDLSMLCSPDETLKLKTKGTEEPITGTNGTLASQPTRLLPDMNQAEAQEDILTAPSGKWNIDNETPKSPNKLGDKLDQPVNLNSTSGDLSMLCSPDEILKLKTKGTEEPITGTDGTSASQPASPLPDMNQTEVQEAILMDCVNVSTSLGPAQNTHTSGKNVVPSPKQDATINPIHDGDSDSDSGEDSTDADNSDSDSNTQSAIDSDNDPMNCGSIQDSATTDETTASPSRTHVNSDLAETRRISTRNRKAPSSKSRDFLW